MMNLSLGRGFCFGCCRSVRSVAAMSRHEWVPLKEWHQMNASSRRLQRFLRRACRKARLYRAWEILEKREEEAASRIQVSFRRYRVHAAWLAVECGLEWFKAMVRRPRLRKRFQEFVRARWVVVSVIPHFLSLHVDRIVHSFRGVLWLEGELTALALGILQRQLRRFLGKGRSRRKRLEREEELARLRLQRFHREQQASVLVQRCIRGWIRRQSFLGRIQQHRAAVAFAEKVCDPRALSMSAMRAWRRTKV